MITLILRIFPYIGYIHAGLVLIGLVSAVLAAIFLMPIVIGITQSACNKLVNGF